MIVEIVKQAKGILDEIMRNFQNNQKPLITHLFQEKPLNIGLY